MKLLNDFKCWIQSEFVKTNTLIDESTIELLYASFFKGLTLVAKPKLIVLGGGPGSGKTTYYNNLLKQGLTQNFHLHDMDKVLLMLPRYQELFHREGSLKAFESCWQMAQHIANVMVDFAFKHRFNIIYDRTCGTETSFLALRGASAQGYHITLYGFYVNAETAMQRVQSRAKTEGRIVSDEITCEYLHRFTSLWPYYLKFVDKAVLYDNHGSDLVIIFEMHAKKSFTWNYLKYQEFLSTAYDISISRQKFPNLQVLYDEEKQQRFFEHKANLSLFYSTTTRFKPLLKISELKKDSPLMALAALWAENKWGYLRKFPGMSKRMEIFSNPEKKLYMIFYGEHPIGMFVLYDYILSKFVKKNFPIKELDYFYIDEPFRGLGIGGQILQEIKTIAKNEGAESLLFETLNPNLNHFYVKAGGQELCESQLLGNPVTVFNMQLR